MKQAVRAITLVLAGATLGCAEAKPSSPQPREAELQPAPSDAKPLALQSQEAGMQSGLYEATTLAVSPSGRVVGRFRMEQGGDVTQSCTFTFTGQAKGGTAAIRVIGSPRDRSPTLTGEISADADGVVLKLPGSSGLPGCGMVIGPMAEGPEGLTQSRVAAGDWTELAEVRSARAAFRATPGGTPGKAYVVKGDVVGVQARQDGQVKVVYPSDGPKPVQGWLAAADLVPLEN